MWRSEELAQTLTRSSAPLNHYHVYIFILNLNVLKHNAGRASGTMATVICELLVAGLLLVKYGKILILAPNFAFSSQTKSWLDALSVLSAFFSMRPFISLLIFTVSSMGFVKIATLAFRNISTIKTVVTTIAGRLTEGGRVRVPWLVFVALFWFGLSDYLSNEFYLAPNVIFDAMSVLFLLPWFLLVSASALVIDLWTFSLQLPLQATLLLILFLFGVSVLEPYLFRPEWMKTTHRLLRSSATRIRRIYAPSIQVRKWVLSILIALCILRISSVVSQTVGLAASWLTSSWLNLLLALSLTAIMYVWRGGLKEHSIESRVIVDDVSRLNETVIDRLFYVHNSEDIKQIILEARSQGKSVSMRGQSHTMGGQTIARGGFLIDMKFLNKMSFDSIGKTVTTGPGATWADVIKFVNPHGYAPEVMQSYASFSVGGTIAVNAHGITSDHGMIRSVLSFKMIDANGRECACSRTENAELFACVIGGFGLFGVIYEVTLRVVPNVKIDMDMIKIPLADFPSFYEQILADEAVEVKISRIEITSMDNIFLFLYRRASDIPTISDLSDAPRQMSRTSQLLYKWAMPLKTVQKLRFLTESYTQTPVDWTGEHDRNLLLYESARPLALLYEPLFKLNQTFVLQEYFVPHANFVRWMDLIKPIILRNYNDMSLLNITVRYLYKDDESALPYARQDMFAFVLYWRILRSPIVDEKLAEVHRELIDSTLSLSGTFFLPYRLQYTPEQLRASYPSIDTFFQLKSKYDPLDVFSNAWYEKYRTTQRSSNSKIFLPSKRLIELQENFEPEVISQKRSNSYKQLLSSDEGRKKLRQFLVHVFNIENERSLYAKILRATLRPSNSTDMDVYRELQSVLRNRSIPVFSAIRASAKQLLQLRQQKAEFTDEILSIVSAAGYGGKIHDYASIGDSGKLVLQLRSLLGMRGQMWVIHDKERSSDIIERGSLFPVGEFVQFDYSHVHDVPLRSSSVDLVTINMGLHHFPQARLMKLLSIVRRILRPGGLFLVREHDATPDLVPMLDIAHSVFNVVTRVPADEEDSEIRAFRPLNSWRHIISAAGFKDMQLYGIQNTDPTVDVMMCFAKPDSVAESGVVMHSARESPFSSRPNPNGVKNSAGSFYRLSEWLLVRIAEEYGKFLNHTPWYRFKYLNFVWLSWRIFFEEFGVVCRQAGLREAFLNYGFAMNVVVLPVLTLIFVELWLLAMPILLLYGADNSLVETEEVVVETSETIDWSSVDARIKVVRLSANSNSSAITYDIDIPRHMPFTEILKRMSVLIPSAKLLAVSRQRDLAVEVVVDSQDSANLLVSRTGCKRCYSFRYPTEADNVSHVALGVQVEHLLSLLRYCDQNTFHVAQIFDFLE